MRYRFSYLLGLVSLMVALVNAGCGNGAPTNGAKAAGDKEGGTEEPEPTSPSAPEEECVLDGCAGTEQGSGSGQKQTLTVEPSSAEITVDGELIPSKAFTAKLEGKDVSKNVAWFFERPDIGDVKDGSTFLPTGNVGGSGKLVARLSGAEGSATVTVYIKKTIVSGVSAEQKALLDNPAGGADPTLSIIYPFNKTVFPLGVLAPEIQWNGGNVGDAYKLTIKEKHYTYTEYLKNSPPSRHLIEQKYWEGVSASGVGAESDPVTVTLSRLSGGTAYEPATTSWRIAQGRLKGSVYYWELPDACGSENSNGRILRIKPDSAQVDEFYKPGHCWGCHTVSRDGKTMMATYDTQFPFPMVTLDLTQNPTKLGALTVNSNVRGTFSAFNHTGDKAIISNDASTSPNVDLKIISTLTGEVLNPNAMAKGCGEPAWSPDGQKVAAICNLKGMGWVFDATGGDLAVADVGADGFSTSNMKTIVTKEGGTGRPAYPSFSPGSEWLAFGRPTQGSRSTGSGDLWIVGADGTGLKKLTTASEGGKSFNPVFAPIRAGGYFWVVFISRRDYGNTLVNANRQQLWITAISDPPTGDDPSHPPFYMRGQEGCGKSENAYYAMDPCKEIGESCESGVDCCGKTCVKGEGGGYVCGDAPESGQCSEDGNACTSDADCCNSSSDCLDGFCTPPIPK
jgi:hypothetical protein